MDSESQRAQEKYLNDKFCCPLKEWIENDHHFLLQSVPGQTLQPANLPIAHIIITRVCKYTHHKGLLEGESEEM